MKRYRALAGTGGRGLARVLIQREGETVPQWVADAGTLIEAEMIADALNNQGAVEAARLGVDILDELTVYWEVQDLPPEVQDKFDAARRALSEIGGQ